MPVVVPSRDRFPKACWDVLQDMGVQIKEGSGAQLRIGVFNLMPASARNKTIEQFLSLIGSNTLDIQPVLIRFDEYVPKAGREEFVAFYEPFAEVCKKGLDGLIITGANLETLNDNTLIMPTSDVLYADELKRVLNWARENVSSTIYSCWGAHFALEHFFGWSRADLGTTTYNKATTTEGEAIKTWGLFVHDVDSSACPILSNGFNDKLWVPQSRWGDTPLRTMTDEAKKNLRVIVKSEQSGWHMLVGPNEREIFFQGHPEYYPRDLEGEYLRDKEKFGTARLPVTYYPDDDDTKVPICNWRGDAHVFYRNWMNLLFSKKAAAKLQSKL